MLLGALRVHASCLRRFYVTFVRNRWLSVFAGFFLVLVVRLFARLLLSRWSFSEGFRFLAVFLQACPALIGFLARGVALLSGIRLLLPLLLLILLAFLQ